MLGHFLQPNRGNGLVLPTLISVREQVSLVPVEGPQSQGHSSTYCCVSPQSARVRGPSSPIFTAGVSVAPAAGLVQDGIPEVVPDDVWLALELGDDASEVEAMRYCFSTILQGEQRRTHGPLGMVLGRLDTQMLVHRPR